MTNPTPRASDLVLVPREKLKLFQNGLAQVGIQDHLANYEVAEEAKSCLAKLLAAAPQPPALGSEPDELSEAEIWEIDQASFMQIDFAQGVESRVRSRYRAHLAPLLAEIEQLKQQAEGIRSDYWQERNQRTRLEARIAEIVKVVHDYNTDQLPTGEAARNAMSRVAGLLKIHKVRV